MAKRCAIQSSILHELRRVRRQCDLPASTHLFQLNASLHALEPACGMARFGAGRAERCRVAATVRAQEKQLLGHHLRAHRSDVFPCAPLHGAQRASDALPAARSGEKIFSAAGLNWATNLLPNPAPAIRSLLFSLISRLLKAESSFSRCGRLSRPHREFERWQKYANCWRRYRAGSGVGSPSSSPSPPPACRRLALKLILDITPARCGQRHAPRCWRTLRRT